MVMPSDFNTRQQARDQRAEGNLSDAVRANLANAAAFRDPNSRHTDQRYGVFYAPKNYRTYRTQEVDEEHLIYCAKVEEFFDAKWGLTMHWVEHEMAMWDVIEAMR